MVGAFGHGAGKSRTGQVAAYEGPALVLLLALAAVTVFSLTQSKPLALTRSVPLDATINGASLLIVLGAAYFALGEYMLYGLLASLCIGLAFLVFATADVGMGIVPLLLGWEHHITWISYGWAAERMAGGALLVAAALMAERRIPVYRRVRLAASGLLLTIAFSLVVAAVVYVAGPTTMSTSGQGPLQLIAGILFFLASILFWRESKIAGRTWYVWLGFSLAIAGFAQIQYTFHNYPVGVVQTGDILRLVFFTGILLALAAEWSQNYRRLRWQARELEASHILMTAPMVQDVAAVVHHIEQSAGQALHANARILVPDRNPLHSEDPLAAQMLLAGNPAHSWLDGDNRRPGDAGANGGRQGQIALGVPLRTADRRLGMLIATREGGDEFSTHDIRLLRSFGAQASILLERSLLYEEIEAGAILQERSRLAREIHDGLAQHLAFLKMRVSWLKRSPSSVDAQQLQDVEGVLETALIEARHAITTLRAEPQGTSTVEAIAGYAEEFGQVSGLEVEVSRQGGVAEVGPKTRVELLRVVQEAMNNVRKHACASRIDIEISPRDAGVEVSIRDNGIGFVMEGGIRGHFGLQIMRERAESVGGTLEVQSEPQVGTVVTIWVPGHESESEPAEPRPLGFAQG